MSTVKSVNLRVVSAAFLCAAATSVASTFLWLALTIHLPSFQVTSVIVSSLRTTTSSALTATFHVAVIIGNPNIMHSIWYESLEIELWFDDLTIASAPVEPLPFSQGAQSDTPVQARFEAISAILQRGVSRGISTQRRFGSAVDFGVSFTAQIGFRCGVVRTKVRPLKVYCYPLHVGFPPNENINNNDTGRLVAPIDCYVY